MATASLITKGVTLKERHSILSLILKPHPDAPCILKPDPDARSVHIGIIEILDDEDEE